MNAFESVLDLLLIAVGFNLLLLATMVTSTDVIHGSLILVGLVLTVGGIYRTVRQFHLHL